MVEKNISPEDNIINLNIIYKFIKRNFKTLSYFSLIGMLFVGSSFIKYKKTWRGQFKIVIEKVTGSSPNSSSSRSGGGAQFIFNQLTKGSNDLNTEQEILKSPFILLNVYDFINDFDPLYKSKGIEYKDWVENIKVEFVEGTSVLIITYTDKRKQNIIPVLQEISKRYQEYSGSKRVRDLTLSLDYFEKQIDKYKEKAILSNQELNDFALKHDLIYQKGPSAGINQENMNLVGFNPILDIETKRTEVSNKLRNIDKLIERIKSDEENPVSIIYLSEIINNQISQNSEMRSKRKLIENINLQLVNNRQIYNENDKSIQDLKRQRKIYTESLYKQTLGILEAQRKSSKANLKSLERPPGVISKFKELLRSASKDEILLSKLEDQFRVVSLEKAKIKDPWQLITNPTLDRNPVPSYKLRKIILGLLAGFLTGSFILILREKKERKIFTSFDIESILPGIPIDIFKISEKIKWEEYIHFISIGMAEKLSGNIKMLSLDIENETEPNSIIKIFNSNFENIKIKNTKSIKEAFENDEFLLCIKTSFSSKNNLDLIQKNLSLLNKKIIRIFFIDD